MLDVEPENLPDQVAIEAAGASFMNALNCYLEFHHDLMYSELYDYQIPILDVREPGYHMIIGKSVRTEQSGIHHVVVGHHGQIFWDPHPSRDGLITFEKWGILGPIPEHIKTWRQERRAADSSYNCICSACRSKIP